MPLDGRNWSQTETKPDVFSLEGLIAWLELQPAERGYEYTDCDGGCLIGQYAQAIGHPSWLEIHKYPLPKPHNWLIPAPYTFGNLACDRPRTFGAALSRARALLASRSK